MRTSVFAKWATSIRYGMTQGFDHNDAWRVAPPDAYTACAVGRAKPREGLTELQDRKSRMTQTVQKETDRIMNTVVLRVVNRL